MSVAIFNNTADRDLWKWNWTETWQKDIKCHYFFVCIPANMANLIQWLTSNLYWLWSNVQKPAQWFLHTGLLSLSDRIHSAKTCQSQPEPNWIRAGFAQYYSGCLRKNGTKSESGKPVVGWLHSARKNRAQWFWHTDLLPDKMRLAKTQPGRHTFYIIYIYIYIYCILYDPVRFWLHSGHLTGRNQNASE